MKLSSFMVGFVIIGLVVTVLSLFYADLNDNYGLSSYDNSTLLAYEKFSELNEVSSDINDSLTTVQQGNVIDVVGGLLSSGYTVLKTTWGSFNIYTSITTDAVSQANLGSSAEAFRTAGLIIGFLLFMFALIAVLTGRTDI